jgi:hypothetical protein
VAELRLVLGRLKRLGARLRIGSPKGERTVHASDRDVNTLDALTAAREQHGMPFAPGSIPPGYIKPPDDGRPRR